MTNKPGMTRQSTEAAQVQPTLQAAAQAYAQAEAMFNSIGDGAIATDEFGRITKINQAALDILGYKASGLIGRWFPKAIRAFDEKGELISHIDRPITRAFLTGNPINHRMFYQAKDKGLIPVTLTVSPLVLGGRPIGAVEVFRDITLEYEIDRMKSDFISLASHQLRTPLSAIKTYTHMLLDGFMGKLSAPQRSALRTVVAASNRMNELISMLLNVSRIESGSLAVLPKSINLGNMINEVFKELALTATDKQIILHAKQPKAPAIIRSDALIVKEILINLVSNAIKYTPEGGKVTVSIRGRKHTYVISVSDDGLGIPKAAQEQIFTKFFRAHNVVRQETAGTGLGLYLVKGFSEAIGGKIWFTSTEHIGSTFFVELPRRYTPPADDADEHQV